MGFLGLFKSGKRASESSAAEPEFLRKIDLAAAEQDEASTAAGRKGRKDTFALREEVEPELALWLSNGLTARNFKELAAALKKMSAKDYKDYADSQRNEIAEWVQEILNDKQLAVQLRKAKNRIQAAKLVEKEIKKQKYAKPAKAAAVKVSKAKEKIRSPGSSGSGKKKEREEYQELGIETLPEFPPMPDILPMPKEVERASRIGMTEQEISPEKLKLPKPHLSLWPFYKKKKIEEEQSTANEMSVALQKIPEPPTQQTHERKAKTKTAKKSAMAQESQQLPTIPDEKIVWEEPLPELPAKEELPAEKFELPQLTESLELPAIAPPQAKPETEAAKPPLRIGFADVEKPKRFLFFGRKPKPETEKPAKGLKKLAGVEIIPGIGMSKEAKSNEPEPVHGKHKFGTYLKRVSHGTGAMPEAGKNEETFEPEPHHAKLEDSSIKEELPATEEESMEKMQKPMEEKEERWEPYVRESSPLDKQSKELERIEQMLNREEEELNTQRLELTRRRYEIIKQKGKLEKRRFEEFMDRHKLTPKNMEIVHRIRPEHAVATVNEPERPDAAMKGMPDFRLAGAYGKERVEELLEQAKQHISENDIEAAKRALDEVLAVFNTVYMTTSEKKHMEYEILELEADLKLATLR